MPITREHDIDDDGTGLTGSIRDAAWKERLYDQIDAFVKGGDTPGVITISTAGTQDIVLPTPRSFYYVRTYPSTGDITLRSLTAGRVGDLVLIENVVNTGGVTWLQHNVGSGGNTKLFNRVTSGSTPIASGGSALYVFDAGPENWRLAQHDQGVAIRVPFAASNYAPNAGTWTVEAGDVVAHEYLLRSNVLTVIVSIQTAPISGAIVATVKGWPFNFGTTFTLPAFMAGNSTTTVICGRPNGNSPTIDFFKFDVSALPGTADFGVTFNASVKVL